VHAGRSRLPGVPDARELVRWRNGLRPQYRERLPCCAADSTKATGSAAAAEAEAGTAAASRYAPAGWMQRHCQLDVHVTNRAASLGDERFLRSCRR